MTFQLMIGSFDELNYRLIDLFLLFGVVRQGLMVCPKRLSFRSSQWLSAIQNSK